MNDEVNGSMFYIVTHVFSVIVGCLDLSFVLWGSIATDKALLTSSSLSYISFVALVSTNNTFIIIIL